MKARFRTYHRRRICQYLGLGCTHELTFFSLPLPVREEIYHYAGLLRGTQHDLELGTIGGNDEPGQFRNVLLSCRAVYEEASTILYSSNQFVVRYYTHDHEHGLVLLKYCSPITIAALKHLTIILNPATAHMLEQWQESYRRSHYPWSPCDRCGMNGVCTRTRKPLNYQRKSFNKILQRWQDVVRHLAAHVTPGQLHLRLICEVDSLTTAGEILQPLTCLPKLADCSLRLCTSEEPRKQELQQLAKETCARLTQRFIHQSANKARLSTLPKELRIAILSFTNLVHPLGEITWKPSTGFFSHYHAVVCNHCHTYGDWPDDHHNVCCVERCSQNGIELRHLFCQRSSASWSSACRCWTAPTAIFLVSQAIRIDALEVFFRNNRFVVAPEGGSYGPAKRTPPRLEISRFLADVVPHNALRHLRSLEIVFPPSVGDYLPTYCCAYEHWLRTIDLLQTDLCLSRLTLRVYFPDIGKHNHNYYSQWPEDVDFDAVGKSYYRTLMPLARLSGLYRLYVYLHVSGARRGPGETDEWRERWHTIEQWIERSVMGNDYDSRAKGKYNLKKSQWSLDREWDWDYN